jgi:hypothetical protein
MMAAAAVMERKATPHISARRGAEAPSAHSAEAPSAHSAHVACGESAAAEATRMAASGKPAASVAHPAAPREAAASVTAASAASAGVRSCCNGASGERASEQNDHRLFQHLNFLSWPPVSLAAVAGRLGRRPVAQRLPRLTC